jgi:hypothetical protein
MPERKNLDIPLSSLDTEVNDCFTTEPDFCPCELKRSGSNRFDSAKAKEAMEQ